ncbi:MAG: acetolactate synthase small subunit [Treponema sp.]|jgi:acetolactate synthase-1/3 small subunit|nr:acetolactate synthase small subunit [Treponema sp.]
MSLPEGAAPETRSSRSNRRRSEKIPRTHVVSALVENRAGTLSRISGLFARRGYNIDSLTVGETQDSSISRMTIAVTGDDAVLEQIVKQLEKLVDVISVRELEPASCLRREIMLVKVRADQKNRPSVIQIAGIFRSRVVDVSASTITIEATGGMEKLNGLIMLLSPYGILELARTGMVALERGGRVLSIGSNRNAPA